MSPQNNSSDIFAFLNNIDDKTKADAWFVRYTIWPYS